MVFVFLAHMKTLFFGVRLEKSCSRKLFDTIFLQSFLDNEMLSSEASKLNDNKYHPIFPKTFKDNPKFK